MQPKRKWYIPDETHTGTQGPFSTEDMLAKVERGELRADSFAWSKHFGDKQWRRVGEIEEFKDLFMSYPEAPIPEVTRLTTFTETQQLQTEQDDGKHEVEIELRTEDDVAVELEGDDSARPAEQESAVVAEAESVGAEFAEAEAEHAEEPKAADTEKAPADLSEYYGARNSLRRFPRVPLRSQAILHNQSIYRKMECFDISEKGVFLRTDEIEVFSRGEEVVVTVKGVEGLETFSVPAVVMKVVKEGATRGIGLYFLRLNPKLRRAIARFIGRRLKGSSETDSGRGISAA